MVMGNRDLWLPILVGTVVLGGLGYLVVKVSDIGGTLQSVDTKVASTKERVDRIADALPDMNIRIAHEEIEKPISSILLTTKPSQDKDGEWSSITYLIDPKTGEKITYKIALKNKDDKRSIYLVEGASHHLEENVVSVDRLEEWSSATQSPLQMPNYVESSQSLVFRNTSTDKLREVLVEVSSGSGENTKLNTKIENWKDLHKVVTQNDEGFNPALK